MAHSEDTSISIVIPDIAKLGDDDMRTIAPFRDGRWSNQTKQLLVKFGTQKLDLNRGWASAWIEWNCPCCKRHKRQIVRMTCGGVLLCHLEHHHDHLDDYVKRLFRDINPPDSDADTRIQVSRGEGALRLLVERFEGVLICVDCNLAEGRVKREFRGEIVPHFTFTPSEIASFITIRDNRQHEVDFNRARTIWVDEKEDFTDRIDFAQRMATRIANGRHRRVVAPGQKLHVQLQTKDICFRLCEEQLPSIHQLHLGEAIEARSVARDGVGGTKKPLKRQKGQPPTDVEFASIDAEQTEKNKHWRDAGDEWKCPCCERSKREIYRRSRRGNWTAKIHRFEGFELEVEAEHLWRRRLGGAGDLVISAPKYELICQDCREIVAQLRQRRADLDARALTLENLRELAGVPVAHLAHDIDFERAEEMVTENSALLDAIDEFEEHLRQMANIRIEHIQLKMAGCSESEARDLIGYRIAKARDWELEEGDTHADWVLEEADRLSAF